MTDTGTKPLAPVTYCGRVGDDRVGYLDLWTLDEAVEGLGPAHTTLSEETIREKGWAVPNRKVGG